MTIFKKYYLLIFLMIPFLESCHKKKDAPAPQVTSTAVFFEEKFSVDVDGKNFTNKQFPYSGHGWEILSSSDLASFFQTDTNISLYVHKSNFKDPDTSNKGYFTPTQKQFDDFFKPGTYKFRVDSLSDGVAVDWYVNKLKFSTDYGPQDGSTFSISYRGDSLEPSRLSSPFPAYNRVVKVKSAFNCKVYSKDKSKYMTLNNGIYWGRFSYGSD